jgi:HEXXH motif-containing protein
VAARPDSLEPPKDLAVPREGSTTTRTILSRALGRVCRELPGVVRAHATGERREDALAIDHAIGLLARSDPGVLASVLRRPHTSTLARVLRSPQPDAPALASELFALLAFDLAWLGVLPSSVTLRHLPRRLVSPAARVAIDVPEGLRAATFSAGKAAFEGTRATEVLDLDALSKGGSHPWCTRPYRDLRGGALLALADNNPLSGIEAHPDKKTPNSVDLGGHPETEWVAAICTALSAIETGLPAMASDVALVLQQVVPTGFDPDKHLSCSYQEDVGTVYASLHPQVLTMAEAIVHEVSHNKLNALLDLDPIVDNGRDELHASPLRPDPRPIQGVLLAVHAFVPVACMYEGLIAGRAGDHGPFGPRHKLEGRLAAIVQSNRAGTDVLRANARPTPVGQGLLGELLDWDNHFRRWG